MPDSLAESILKKLVANGDPVLTEAIPEKKGGGYSVVFDSSWCDITDEEMEYLNGLAGA